MNKLLKVTWLVLFGAVLLTACNKSKIRELEQERNDCKERAENWKKVADKMQRKNQEVDSLFNDSGISFNSLNKTRRELDSLIKAGKGDKVILLKIEQVDSIVRNTYKKIDFLEQKLQYERTTNKNVDGLLKTIANLKEQLREQEKDNQLLKVEVKNLKGNISVLRTRIIRKENTITGLERDVQKKGNEVDQAKRAAEILRQKRVEIIVKQVNAYMRDGDDFKSKGDAVRSFVGKRKKKLYLNAYRMYYKAYQLRLKHPDLALAIRYTTKDIQAQLKYLAGKLGRAGWVQTELSKIKSEN